MQILSRDLIRNCTHKVRFRYTLDQSLAKKFIKLFDSKHVTINYFSQIVEGAKDHFYIDIPDRYHLSGVLKSNEVIVTYMTSYKKELNDLIVFLENKIRTT